MPFNDFFERKVSEKNQLERISHYRWRLIKLFLKQIILCKQSCEELSQINLPSYIVRLKADERDQLKEKLSDQASIDAKWTEFKDFFLSDQLSLKEKLAPPTQAELVAFEENLQNTYNNRKSQNKNRESSAVNEKNQLPQKKHRTKPANETVTGTSVDEPMEPSEILPPNLNHFTQSAFTPYIASMGFGGFIQSTEGKNNSQPKKHCLPSLEEMGLKQFLRK